MESVALVRLAALRQICASHSWTPADLHREIGTGTSSYWSELLRGKKSFGEKAARRIEQALNLPAGCLDEDNGPPITASALSPRARRLAVAFDAMPNGQLKDATYTVLARALQIDEPQ